MTTEPQGNEITTSIVTGPVTLAGDKTPEGASRMSALADLMKDPGYAKKDPVIMKKVEDLYKGGAKVEGKAPEGSQDKSGDAGAFTYTDGQKAELVAQEQEWKKAGEDPVKNLEEITAYVMENFADGDRKQLDNMIYAALHSKDSSPAQMNVKLLKAARAARRK